MKKILIVDDEVMLGRAIGDYFEDLEFDVVRAVADSGRGGEIALRPGKLIAGLKATWFNPRDGSSKPASATRANTYRTPDSKDWVLLLRK